MRVNKRGFGSVVTERTRRERMRTARGRVLRGRFCNALKGNLLCLIMWLLWRYNVFSVLHISCRGSL